MGILEDLWFGNYEPNLYEVGKEEKQLTNQLDEITKRVQEKYPDEPDIKELIDASSRLMCQQTGRAYREGTRFGFYFAKSVFEKK